jgi:hypothetical protein
VIFSRKTLCQLLEKRIRQRARFNSDCVLCELDKVNALGVNFILSQRVDRVGDGSV